MRNLFLNNTAAYGNTPRDKKTDINKAAQIGEQNKIIIAVSDETKSICNCNRKHDNSDYRQSFLFPFSHTAYLIFTETFTKSLYHNARLISTDHIGMHFIEASKIFKLLSYFIIYRKNDCKQPEKDGLAIVF